MFSLKHKLSECLRNCLDDKCYKNYRVIIQCKNLLSKTEHKIKYYGGSILRTIPSINCISANVSPRAIERLIELPQIKYIDFDEFALLCGSGILTSNHISYHKNFKFTGKNICVGIIDSGVFPHKDLLYPTNKISNFIDLVNGLNYPYDDNGHGTFISGIISGSGYKSKGSYKGIASDSSIYMVKCFNSCGRGFVSNIFFALELLIKDSKNINLKVICLPFEIIEYNKFILSMFSNLFDLAVQNNITIVVPSGHNGNSKGSIRGIASLDNCITVAGLDTTNSIKAYNYSSAGPCMRKNKPTIAAACVNICSLNSDTNYLSERNGMKVYPNSLKKDYTTYTGTSCAAAYVSGICALLYEKNSDLSYKDILSLFKLYCNLLDIPQWIQGYGMLDIKKLLAESN